MAKVVWSDETSVYVLHGAIEVCRSEFARLKSHGATTTKATIYDKYGTPIDEWKRNENEHGF